jgi:ABC-type lipoprotein release transport system permease subunit
MPPQTPPTPIIGRSVLAIALRYLVRKKLSYLAIVGIALSVGTLIVVMSVFTGFHDQMVSAIRGYQSDLVIRSGGGEAYGMDNWQLWRRLVLKDDRVSAAAPFVDGFALLRLPYSQHMAHVRLRGIDPTLEPDVSDLNDFMLHGASLDMLTDADWDSVGGLRSVFVGRQFPGFQPPKAGANPPLYSMNGKPPEVYFITATPDLNRRLSAFAVRGLFRSGHTDYDSEFAIMSLAGAQNFVGAGSAVTGLSVKLKDYDADADAVKASIKNKCRTGSELGALPLGAVELLVMSGDASTCAAVTAEGTIVVQDIAAGRERLRIDTAPSAPCVLALDPTGQHLLVAAEDGSADVVIVEGGTRLPLRKAGSAPLTAAVFSEDGLLLALGADDGRAVILETPEEGIPVEDMELAAMQAHTGRVTSVAFDPLSRRLATAGRDDRLRLWDAETGRPVGSVAVPGAVSALAFSPDGKHMAVASDASLTLVNVKSHTSEAWATPSTKSVDTWTTLCNKGGAFDTEEAFSFRRSTMQATPNGMQIRTLTFRWSDGLLLTASDSGLQSWRLGASTTNWLDSSAPEQPRKKMKRPRIGPYGLVRTWHGPNLKHAALSRRGHYALVAGAADASLVYFGPNMRVLSWQDQAGVLLEAVAMERFLMALIVSLILVVAEFLIFTIVSTIVAEHRRDIGILKTIGFTRGQACKVFLTVGLAVGAIGAALGVAAGLLFTANINAVRDAIKAVTGWDPFPDTIYYFKDIPTRIQPEMVIYVVLGAVLCSLFFSLLPSLRAARMDPVQSLHYE